MTRETKRTWAEIHLDRLAHNYHELRKRARSVNLSDW